LPSAEAAKELYVAAPYFGDSSQGLDLLAERYLSARLNLFPAVHSGNAVNLPLKQIREARKKARIAALNVSNKKSRFVHLKLYGVSAAEDSSWLFCGSANCTLAAWNGDNIEAGLLRKVTPALLKDLFTSAEKPLPEARLPKESLQQFSDTLYCWATDTGKGLELQIANDEGPRLPLRDVTIEVRAGSHIAVFHAKTLFQSSAYVYLAWDSFVGWRRHLKVALCLELNAIDSRGHRVQAHRLIENRLLLSADPSHRSAWRGAQALLDAEGAPEMGDIAAIFSMAHDVFGGKLVALPVVNPSDAGGSQKEKKEEAVVGIAAWPPQPDTHEMQKQLHSTALGQLKWFQQILSAFLKNPTIDEPVQEHGSAYSYQSDSEDYQKKQESDFGKQQDRMIKHAERIWNSAYDDYLRLRDKLSEFCPTAINAPNIWPAAIFAFLSTMAVFHSARRKAPDLPAKIGIDEGILCDDFFRAMFNPRPQHDDYCPPKGFRYRQERFPALADDLFETFKIRLHPDLATVILAMAIDRHLRNDNPVFRNFLPLSKARLAMVCDETFVANAEMRDACRRIWRRYLQSETSKESAGAFDQQFNSLFNLKTESVA
jgi:hypothetical protein